MYVWLVAWPAGVSHSSAMALVAAAGLVSAVVLVCPPVVDRATLLGQIQLKVDWDKLLHERYLCSYAHIKDLCLQHNPCKSFVTFMPTSERIWEFEACMSMCCFVQFRTMYVILPQRWCSNIIRTHDSLIMGGGGELVASLFLFNQWARWDPNRFLWGPIWATMGFHLGPR
jgi:hypothetical protein